MHRLKNPKSATSQACSKLRTKRRFGLTGTAIQNEPMDLWALFEAVSPHCLGLLSHFKAHYAVPIKAMRKASAMPHEISLGKSRQKELQQQVAARSRRVIQCVCVSSPSLRVWQHNPMCRRPLCHPLCHRSRCASSDAPRPSMPSSCPARRSRRVPDRR